MLEGTESTRHMTFPDLNVRIGGTGVSIECKLLGTHGNQPRDYVYDGIARFVTGTYAGTTPLELWSVT